MYYGLPSLENTDFFTFGFSSDGRLFAEIKDIFVFVFTGDTDLTGLTAFVGFIGCNTLCVLRFLFGLSSDTVREPSPVTVRIVNVVELLAVALGSVCPRRLKTEDCPYEK